MFQSWIKFLLWKSAGSELKCSETQVRAVIIVSLSYTHIACLHIVYWKQINIQNNLYMLEFVELGTFIKNTYYKVKQF